MAEKNLVKELRDYLDLTQQELADTMGWYQADISNMERGTRALSATAALEWWDQYRPLLLRLGFTLEDLLRLGRG
jgi:DNA-binding XRE family transcriptional regulator